MKKLLLLFLAALTMLFTGCMQFDDTRIWDAIDELEDLFKDLDDRVEDLEEACEKMNTNIEALQTLITALQAHDTITAITPIKQGDKIIGYTITFTKSEPITIYHGNDGKDGTNGTDGKDGQDGENGKDGKDGYTPTIGVAQEDGVYYWTLDGEWLLDDNGNKIKAVGTDGKDGADGEDGKDGANGEDGKDGENGTNGENGKDGEDGADGKDGITPQLEIREGYWYISYDNGTTWVELGKATGEDGADGEDGKDGEDGEDGKDGADGEDGKDGENGKDGKDGADGDSLFLSVTWDEEYAYFTLSDGTVIKIPLSEGAVSEVLDVNINHFYVEFRESGADDIHTYLVILSDSFDIVTEEFNSESGFIYNLCFCSNVKTNVLPNGTYNLSDTYEANTVSGVEGTLCMIVNNDEWSYHDGTKGVVTISDNKLDATFTLDNGEVHHVVYEGSLKLYEEGEEEDTTTPPANEIWYTSTDGNIVEPRVGDEGNFDANVISNIYQDDRGIIIFDTDLEVIGMGAFTLAENLQSLTIPNNVFIVGNPAIACYNLVEFCGVYASKDGRGLVVDGEMKSFAPSGLTEYTIPEEVTTIGFYSFGYCESLEKVIIPETVSAISNLAFPDSPNIKAVYCKSTTPPTGGGDMFYNHASDRKIYVPAESVDAYKSAEYWSDYADDIVGYDFGGSNSGDTNGVKEVAAVSLGGMWAMWQEEAIIPISGFISDKPFNGDFLSIDSWSYGFTIISDTEPINDEIPLGTYTYVDYEKIVNGEEELKAGTFVMEQLIDNDITTQCFYTNANGETQGFNYTEGVMVVSEGKIELTVTLENGEVHHVVYEGSLQTWGQGA